MADILQDEEKLKAEMQLLQRELAVLAKMREVLACCSGHGAPSLLFHMMAAHPRRVVFFAGSRFVRLHIWNVILGMSAVAALASCNDCLAMRSWHDY